MTIDLTAVLSKLSVRQTQLVVEVFHVLSPAKLSAEVLQQPVASGWRCLCSSPTSPSASRLQAPQRHCRVATLHQAAASLDSRSQQAVAADVCSAAIAAACRCSSTARRCHARDADQHQPRPDAAPRHKSHKSYPACKCHQCAMWQRCWCRQSAPSSGSSCLTTLLDTT